MTAVFVVLTFAISMAGFLAIRTVPGAQSPDSARGLPFWLLTVWGPTLAALILAVHAGTLSDLLRRAVQLEGVPPLAWTLVVAPLALLVALRSQAPAPAAKLGAGTMATMVAFNLMLGPMGEELGWRGVLQHGLTPDLGWLGASLVTGVVWLIWHLPLWTINSPQAAIRLPLFAGHCMAYAVIIGAAYAVSQGSVLPAILIHLTFNLAANWASYAGYPDPNDWFRQSLLPYGGIAVASIVAVTLGVGL